MHHITSTQKMTRLEFLDERRERLAIRPARVVRVLRQTTATATTAQNHSAPRAARAREMSATRPSDECDEARPTTIETKR
jgi:hypothetical protein